MAILISTPQDLNNIRNNLTGTYELVNDIDMSSYGNFTPIGTYNTRFTGTLDGKGFKIKNLTINVSSTYIGLFGVTENATISNLSIENANVNSNMQNYVGILIAYPFGTTIVSNCYTTGTVNGQYGIGGLIGYGDAIITNSYSHANVTGKGRVGGLVGNLNANSSINKSYSTGLVTVTPDPNVYNGGLVGSVAGTPSITDSYWDINTSGQTKSVGGTGLTTTQMKSQSSYTNWDFVNVWGINNDYPYLQVFGIPQSPAKIETITVNSYINIVDSQSNKITKSTKQSSSYIEPITSSVSRSKRSQYNVDSFMLPISTNVQRSTRSVRTGNYNVVTFINPITSSIERRTKTYKNLLSYVSNIDSNINVKYPTIIINAYTSILENPSSISTLNNLSSLSKIENPSFLEVV